MEGKIEITDPHQLRTTITLPELNAWIEALRSGKYKQAQGVLRRGNTFCCLGVYCDVQNSAAWEEGRNEWSHYGAWAMPSEANLPLLHPPSEIVLVRGEYVEADTEPEWFTLDFEQLASLNDDKQADFEEIASILEEYRDHVNLPMERPSRG